MFAMKSMDKLLHLKLDMVYRSLSVEEAQKLHSELQPAAPLAPKPKTAIKGKAVKTIKQAKK